MDEDFSYEKSIPEDFNTLAYYLNGKSISISEGEHKARCICSNAYTDFYQTQNAWFMIQAFLMCKENNLPILAGLREIVDELTYKAFSRYSNEAHSGNDRYTLDKAFNLTPGKVRIVSNKKKQELITLINKIRFDFDIKVNGAVRLAIKLNGGFIFKTAYDYYVRDVNERKYLGFYEIEKFTLTHAHMIDKSLDDALKRYPTAVHTLIRRLQRKFPK